MITVTAQTIEEAVYKSYNKLYCTQNIVSDPAILKEDSAVITILNATTPSLHFAIEDEVFKYTFDHSSYIPSVEYEKIHEEEIYWSNVLLKTRVKERFVKHLKENSSSRRALYDLWKEDYFNNPEQGGACITQLYLRIKGDKLELHTHARANDAHRCLLMDLHMMSAIHIWVANELSLSVGKHIHFVDALHLYKKYQKNIEQQIEVFKTSDLWNVYE